MLSGPVLPLTAAADGCRPGHRDTTGCPLLQIFSAQRILSAARKSRRGALDTDLATSEREFSDVFREYGFAFLRVGPSLGALLRRCAWGFAHDFFEALPRETKAGLQHVDAVGALHGWNQPSATKEVFRIASVASVIPAPWPSHALASDATAVYRRMHSLGVACLAVLLQRDHAMSSKACTEGWPSPLDIFFYPNDMGDEAAAEVANLAPHFDPGYLTLVPVAATPGLALRSKCPSRPRWFKVEEEMGLEPYRHVVVFPGAASPGLSSLRAPAAPSVARALWQLAEEAPPMVEAQGSAASAEETVGDGRPLMCTARVPFLAKALVGVGVGVAVVVVVVV